MKAVIRVDLIDPDKGTATGQLSVEAPTLEMLKDTVTRTMLLQMTDLLKQVFEIPKFTKEEPRHEPAAPKAAAGPRPKPRPKPRPAARAAPADNPGG